MPCIWAWSAASTQRLQLHKNCDAAPPARSAQQVGSSSGPAIDGRARSEGPMLWNIYFKIWVGPCGYTVVYPDRPEAVLSNMYSPLKLYWGVALNCCTSAVTQVNHVPRRSCRSVGRTTLRLLDILFIYRNSYRRIVATEIVII